jgi:hypothetical protein
VLSFLLSVVLKIIDFKQHMGFKGSFNRNYLRMKKTTRKIFHKHIPWYWFADKWKPISNEDDEGRW